MGALRVAGKAEGRGGAGKEETGGGGRVTEGEGESGDVRKEEVAVKAEERREEEGVFQQVRLQRLIPVQPLRLRIHSSHLTQVIQVISFRLSHTGDSGYLTQVIQVISHRWRKKRVEEQVSLQRLVAVQPLRLKHA